MERLWCCAKPDPSELHNRSEPLQWRNHHADTRCTAVWHRVVLRQKLPQGQRRPTGVPRPLAGWLAELQATVLKHHSCAGCPLLCRHHCYTRSHELGLVCLDRHQPSTALLLPQRVHERSQPPVQVEAVAACRHPLRNSRVPRQGYRSFARHEDEIALAALTGPLVYCALLNCAPFLLALKV